VSGIADVVRRNAIPLTLNRPATETVDARGRVVRGNSSVAGVRGHIQPYSPRELRQLSEGERVLEWYHVWSLIELKVGDRMTDGYTPLVKAVRVEYWKEGPFWHAHATKAIDTTSLPAS